MRVLTVPNWSFGRDSDLLSRFRETLEGRGLEVHSLQSDVDHNRTITAFSGDTEDVFAALERLCELAFDRIDLNRHVGVHPRIGALDVCPFVPYPEPQPTTPKLQLLKKLDYGDSAQTPIEDPESAVPQTEVLLRDVETFSARLAGKFGLPVFLYEKSERGRHEADLPSLRKGGFGSLIEAKLNPDFGPSTAHPLLGASVVGVRDFLISMNLNFAGEEATVTKEMSRHIRSLRASGDLRFLGVRARHFVLASRRMTQIGLNLTLPNITSPDLIAEWVIAEALARQARFIGPELVGVIRQRDLPGSERLVVRESQIVDL